jgi:polyisoprenoid-binding protein YceI
MLTNSSTTLPLAPGVWVLDPAHCTVEFTVRHMAISKVRGRFHTFTAELIVGDTLDATSVQATVDLSSVDTNNADRDAHLRSTDFFSVDAHPNMTFTSKAITEVGPQRYEITGDMTINGVTRTETLAVTFNGVEVYPMDASRHAGFEATGTINRKDYGIDFNVPLAAGGFVIADRVGIELDLQLRGPDL